MHRFGILCSLISIICSANSQQGQNFYFAGGGGGSSGGGGADGISRQQTRFVPYQQNQFSAIPQQTFANYFQTNAGPYLPFRSPNFQLPGAADTSANAFPSSVSGDVLASDPRYDPLISAPGVYADPSNDDYADIGGSYIDRPPSPSQQSAATQEDVAATPSQHFNTQVIRQQQQKQQQQQQQQPQSDRQSSPQQFRSQLARLSPIAISEVTRTQDSPNSPNALQTHSFNVHHTTRNPDEIPSRAASSNRWRDSNNNNNFRGRNVAFPVETNGHDAAELSTTFPKFNNRFAVKEQQTFLVNTQHPESVVPNDDRNSNLDDVDDSLYTQYVQPVAAHETYFSPPATSGGGETQKVTGKSKNQSRGRPLNTNNVTPTTYVPSVSNENRARFTTALAASEVAATTFRTAQGGGRGQGRARGKSVRPTGETETRKVNKLTTTPSSVDDFDVVTMSQEHLFVSEDNFKGFIDSASIDSTEVPVTEDTKDIVESATTASVPASSKKQTFSNHGTKAGEEVVTTRATPSTATTSERMQKAMTTRRTIPFSPSTTTEGWIIVASVQTSRSVSGARFIPSSAIRQEQHPLPLDAKSIKDIKTHLATHKNDSVSSELLSALSQHPTAISKTTTANSSSPPSEEDIHDESDQAQSGPTGSASIYHEKHSSHDLINAITQPTRLATDSASPDDDSTKRRFTQSSSKTTTSSSSTTAKPKLDRKSLFENIQFDDLTGLLPEGFKARGTFTPSSKKGHGSTTKSTETSVPTTEKSVSINEKSKNKAAVTSSEKLKSKIKFDDVSRFLPPGYKQPPSEDKPEMVESSSNIEIKSKPRVPDGSGKTNLVNASTHPPSRFQPQNARPIEKETSSKVNSLLSRIQFKEADDLLPSDYTTVETPLSSSTAAITTTTTATKVVFPSRSGSSPKKPPINGQKNNSAAVKSSIPSYQVPVIHKGWPIRSTTEFAGWPSPSPSPISIEKVLQAAKEAATETNEESLASSITTPTTTVTTTTKRSTTPGICSHDCDLAGSIKLIGGVKWVPELLDHNTNEWRTLANDVQHQLEVIFQSSETLSRWYRRITIDAFSPGSVIVDYFVELSDLGRTVNTADMKRLFHETLVEETVTSESFVSSNGSDYRQLKLGKFVVDSAYTDFVVLPKSVMPPVRVMEADMWLPQWAIAVIVIGLASLLFVLIFGITVIISRHKNAKKNPTALTEEMLNELNKNHMSGGFENYGADDLYNMEDVWNEKPLKKYPRGNYYPEESMPNIYDSWRSDWNGYQYGNSCYNGSIRSGFSRRRSDYDTNF